MSKFNEFGEAHGMSLLLMDPELKIYYEDKKTRTYWGSIYGSTFRRFPIAALRSEAAFQDWCLEVAGMYPERMGPAAFAKFMREHLARATVKETLPGDEDGAVIGKIVLRTLIAAYRGCPNFVEQDISPDAIDSTTVVFIDDYGDGCGKEVFVRIEALMDKVTYENSIGRTEKKALREEVIDWVNERSLRHLPREASPRRFRSAYVLPIELIEEAGDLENYRKKLYDLKVQTEERREQVWGLGTMKH